MEVLTGDVNPLDIEIIEGGLGSVGEGINEKGSVPRTSTRFPVLVFVTVTAECVSAGALEYDLRYDMHSLSIGSMSVRWSQSE